MSEYDRRVEPCQESEVYVGSYPQKRVIGEVVVEGISDMHDIWLETIGDHVWCANS